jgi:hypothetical protein
MPCKLTGSAVGKAGAVSPRIRAAPRGLRTWQCRHVLFAFGVARAIASASGGAGERSAALFDADRVELRDGLGEQRRGEGREVIEGDGDSTGMSSAGPDGTSVSSMPRIVRGDDRDDVAEPWKGSSRVRMTAGRPSSENSSQQTVPRSTTALRGSPVSGSTAETAARSPPRRIACSLGIAVMAARPSIRPGRGLGDSVFRHNVAHRRQAREGLSAGSRPPGVQPRRCLGGLGLAAWVTGAPGDPRRHGAGRAPVMHRSPRHLDVEPQGRWAVYHVGDAGRETRRPCPPCGATRTPESRA